MKNLGSRRTTGSSGATSQAQADVTCRYYYYVSGIPLIEQSAPQKSILVGQDIANRTSLPEVNSQTYSTTGLS